MFQSSINKNTNPAEERNIMNYWLIEESSGHLRSNSLHEKKINLYKIYGESHNLIASYDLLDVYGKSIKKSAISSLIDEIPHSIIDSQMVIFSHNIYHFDYIFEKLKEKKIKFAAEIPISLVKKFATNESELKDYIKNDSWKPILINEEKNSIPSLFFKDKNKKFKKFDNLDFIYLSIGGIIDNERGFLCSVTNSTINDVEYIKMLHWIKKIRQEVRKTERIKNTNLSAKKTTFNTMDVKTRPNISLSTKSDAKLTSWPDSKYSPIFKGKLKKKDTPLTVVELFAGAGGMGLGFLLSKSESKKPNYKIIYSAEINPVYVNTLRYNHNYMAMNGITSKECVPNNYHSVDLKSKDSIKMSLDLKKTNNIIDVLIGGPPCQGFSSANRNSWSSKNPNNQLVDAFLDHVEILNPKVILMENVQGILWTAKGNSSGELSVAEHVVSRLNSLGYLVFPKMVDAAWYGVPQHRNRFFIMCLHKTLDYKIEDFGMWGPFPKPTHGPGTTTNFVTVSDAIADLPEIFNGENIIENRYFKTENMNEFQQYCRSNTPPNIIWDHITSKHSNYVIERYKKIPEGGNWENIIDMMTNYSGVNRTHSNIYRRLKMNSASITIGHYRKSMLIHPTQDRGLSLREAARLQSFPDWFRFSGGIQSIEGGLMHKQQQLANAVCPLVTKKIAEFILNL